MKAKLEEALSVILPSKRLNIFITFIIILGIISGTIFLILINPSDKELVTKQITTFINNINNNNIDSINLLKNTIYINYTYIILIWVLGLSLVGSILNIFIIYIKSFILGFIISSFIYVYNTKGILASIIYILPNQLINLLILLILTIYSITLSFYIYRVIIGNRDTGIKRYLKKYIIILLLISIITLFTTLLEVYFTPSLYKLLIKLFV